ncbi:MAG: hypothetical protein WB810_13225, partial [Candidatus Cybelea sp.]
MSSKDLRVGSNFSTRSLTANAGKKKTFLCWTAKKAIDVMAVAALIGCGSAQSMGPAPANTYAARTLSDKLSPGLRPMRTVEQTSPWPGYKFRSPLLFVVNFVTNSTVGNVVVYDPKFRNPTPIATITNGLFQPNGACIDAKG